MKRCYLTQHFDIRHSLFVIRNYFLMMNVEQGMANVEVLMTPDQLLQ
jgi:hypothetical protein